MACRVVLGFFSVLPWMLLPGGVDAQQSAFNFNYPGPNNIPVDTFFCTNILAGNIGNPVVTSTVGATIILSEFNAAASGFTLNADWNFGETAQVFWNVADNQGNSATFSFFVFIVDTTAPVVLTAGTPPTATYPSISVVPAAPVLAAYDPCGNPTVSFSESPRPPLCSAGTFTRTWLATDVSGNTGVFTQTITILVDTLPPTVTALPQNGSAPCTQVATAYPAWLAAQMANFQVTDPSGVASKTNNAPPTLVGICPAPLVVTFQATDSCGYSVTRTATFTSVDTKGPDILRAPQDSVAACSPPNDNHLAALADWIQRRAGLIAADSCTPEAEIAHFMQINGVPSDSTQVTTAFLASLANGCGAASIGAQTYSQVRGTVAVDFFSRDACGNTTFMGNAVFGAIDTVPPVITGSTFTEECGGGNDSTALVGWINAHGNATATDDCSNFTWTNFSWTTSTGQTGNGSFGTGPYPVIAAHDCQWYADVTFRATDDCGNTGSAVLRFQITDTTAPVFAPLPNDTMYCPNLTPIPPAAFVSDNCDSAVVLTIGASVPNNQICPGSYSLAVTWLATDDCGNTATAMQTVVVRDTTKPFITLAPPNVTIRCDTFALPPNPVLGQGIAAVDNCGMIVGLMVSDVSDQNPDPATCGHYTYTITRTFTVSDDCGNSSTTQQIISVVDNIPPMLTGFLDTTLVCEVLPITPPPAVSDLCSGIASPPVLVSEIIDNPGCGDTYTKILTWESTDVCGNVGQLLQSVQVLDTVPPVLVGVPADATVECNQVPPPPPPSAVTGTDNCDEDVDITFVETIIRDPDPASCAYLTNYTIRREWTVEDNCNNSRTYTQIITVLDQTGPTIVPLDTLLVPTAPGLCSADVPIPALLSVFDDCTAVLGSVELRDTVVLTASGMPIDQVPVNPVVFSWAPPNIPPSTPVVGDAVLTIFLDNADAEQPSETFEIFGENGYVIGRTKLTNVSCGFSDTSFTLPATVLNTWLSDGQLTITLQPNSTGAEAINAFCAGGRARATLTYNIATPQLPVQVSFSVNGGAFQPYPPANAFALDAGPHLVQYEAVDCAGNSSTASTVIVVQDLEPPVVTPPAPITAYVGTANCAATIALPFPDLQENCAFPENLTRTSGVVPVQFEADPNAGWVPKNTILTMTGLIPNAVAAGTLTIRHRGDNGNAGEFFRVLDEGGVFLANTSIATSGECADVHETVLAVSAAQINAWAANGTASFLLQANRDVVNFTDFINPCAPLNAGNFDGISTLEAVLTYNYPVVNYGITKGAQTVQSGQLTGSQTTATLTPGVHTVQYQVSDISGNTGTATYAVTVLDTVPPTANCQPITIFSNPQGSVSYTLQPQEVNNGSVDNCSGANLTMSLSQTNFTCNMATPPNNIYPVTLTVTDTAGNSASCTTTVRVETVAPQPTVTPGVCEGGPVQFFANPPAPTTGYTYLWAGPQGFASMNPNPIIPTTTSANAGTYIVTVTGPTGCTASGSVLLDLTNLPTQPALTAPTLICEGTTLTLQTQPFGGTTVVYSWFSGTPANPTLLGTTTAPIFQIPNPAPGVYQFHAKVTSDGCVSLASDVREVTVQARPVATVVSPTLSVCTCEAISLSTTVQGPGITYNWTGPGGFTSTAQSPLVTSCAQNFHAGVYTLVISANGCASLPATATVEVRPKPAKPQISGDATACAGDTIQLVCNNIPTAGQYQWFSPQAVATPTTINMLVITNASPVLHSGDWRLQVMQNNCLSDLSDPFNVQVQNFPNISATSNSPVCQGGTLNLSANSTMQNVTFVWAGPGGFSAIGANTSTNMPATGNYVVTVSTANGCTNAATVPVSVIAPPEVTSVTHTAPICVDCATDALLQATIFSQNGPLMYTWTGPMGFASSLPQPVIPQVCTSDNGTYNLVVTDASGCVSSPGSTTVNVQRQPERPLLGANQALCIGSPLTISVQNVNVYGSNVVFEWHTPNGIVSQAQANLVIPITGLQHSGDYRLVVKSGNCTSAPSETVTVTVHPIPPAPTVSSNTPVCEGDTLRLFAAPVAGASYNWVGPSGFTASVRDPIIVQVNKNTHQGCYYATVSVNGCVSPVSEGACVDVRSRPPAPTILPISAACLSQPGATLTFQIAPATATPGAQYVWFNSATQAALDAPSFALSYTLTNLAGLQPGQNSFFVRTLLNGCASLPSAPMLVQMDTIPSGVSAFAGQDFNACDAVPIQLSAASPPGTVVGAWSLVSGTPVTIVNQPAPSTQVLGAVAGNTYQFEWVLSNGACKNFSRDTVQVVVNQFEEARVANDLLVTCFSDTVQLNALQGQTIAGTWKQPLGQMLFQPPVTFDNPDDPTTMVRNLPANANTFFFYWILKVAGCPADTAIVTVHTISKQPFAGQDQSLCITDSCALLQATSLDPFETGKWTYLDAAQNPGLTINAPTSPTTIVCDLEFGPNRFLWETNGGLCGDRSRDTVVVFYDLEPTAYEDSVLVGFGQQVTVNVLQNDVVPPQFTIRVLEEPKHGIWSEPSKGSFAYLPDLTFTGRDKLIYELCNLNPACPCSMTTLFFDVEEAGECRIPTIFTPNNDGVNDIFVIPFYCLIGAEGQLDNEVTIFNQWGDQVFHAKPYNNDWEGTYNGQPLPPATYFFVVKLPGEHKARRGFLIIQR